MIDISAYVARIGSDLYIHVEHFIQKATPEYIFAICGKYGGNIYETIDKFHK